MKNFIKIFIFLFCSVILTTEVSSQEKHKTEAYANIVEYTSRDGLPTTNISKVEQTKDGYIWISGMEGTYRFNGYEFEEIGTDIDLHRMQDMYYDSINDVVYFASPQKFIIMKGNDFEVFTEKDGYKINGLAGQMISFINADSKGRIWIGSYTPWVDRKNNGGLTKYENGEFTAYDSTNFPLDNADNFIETPYGDLIFSSSGRNTQTGEGSYIALFKEGSFQRVDETMGIHLQRAIIFYETREQAVDRDGNTWLAFAGINNSINDFSNSGVLMYDGNKFHQYEDLDNILANKQFPIQVYFSETQDKLFLNTILSDPEVFDGNNQGIYELINGKWEPTNIFKDIHPLINLKSGNRIDDFLYSMTFFVPGNRLFPELLVFEGGGNDSQGSAYPNQLFSLNKGRWEKFDAIEGNGNSEIDNGMLFTSPNGLKFYYPNNSRMFTAEDGLLMTQSFVLLPYVDMNGLVWISYSYTELPAYSRTYNVGINVWDGEKTRKITEEDGLASNTTFEICQDSRQKIWIATSKGLTMAREIKNSSGDHILKLNNIPDQEGRHYNTSKVLETRKGEIYSWQNYVRPASQNLIAADYFLGKIEGDRIVRIESPFNEEDNSSKYQLYDLREDSDSRIWFFANFSDDLKNITSAPTKIMIYDEGTWRVPPDSWNIPQEQLHYVGNLESGMYFLTVGDFYVFNGKRFISLGDSTNENADFRILKGASVTGTKTDIQVGDKLYIRLRNKGLVIFDGTRLDFYTKREGLPSANISNPIVDDIRGHVFFASVNGAVKIHGNSFQTFYYDQSLNIGTPNVAVQDGFGNLLEFYDQVGLYVNKIVEESYPLYITSVDVEDSTHFVKFPEELSYSQNSFVFNYAALNYKEPRQTKYEHFLVGYDKDWSRPSPITFAEYQSLPFGEYIFRVRGITSNGIKTNETSYTFVINPPFWRTWWAYSIYGMILILGIIAVDRIQRRRLKIKEQKLISAQELEHAKEIEKAFKELKATQNQLIHAEKMASLGELTAGIAHEIQNPLNFVNNFSDVSVDLVEELDEEVYSGNPEVIKSISKDLKHNLEKIYHHGKRASSIVNGMLEHSRTGNNEKQATNINAMADEYIRLTYHGMKAKNDSFQAGFEVDLDENIGNINVVGKDISRVVLNLITNAFQAVFKKAQVSVDPEYKPLVTISTKKLDGHVQIRVKDNGIGIPEDIKDKIFQPFFTTKPTGEGTGLGLSLSYDIITKGHGGELELETKEGEGSEFIIQLPV